MKRRDFCKTMSCTLVGGVSLASVSEKSLGISPRDKDSDKPRLTQEEKMEKKVICVKAKVISQKGTCGLGHEVGDTVTFTESGVDGKICIHALYSMLPAVFAMMYESKFTWLKDPDTKTHACPDAYNPLVFEITRVRE
jgi:uncharacterized repeat protein (TIGR04076 family)